MTPEEALDSDLGGLVRRALALPAYRMAALTADLEERRRRELAWDVFARAMFRATRDAHRTRKLVAHSGELGYQALRTALAAAGAISGEGERR